MSAFIGSKVEAQPLQRCFLPLRKSALFGHGGPIKRRSVFGLVFFHVNVHRPFLFTSFTIYPQNVIVAGSFTLLFVCVERVYIFVAFCLKYLLI